MPSSELSLIAVSHIVDTCASELLEISEAGAKGLKPRGSELQPVKADMLRLPEREAALVVATCEMLFAACFEYEEGLWAEQHARNAVDLVTARIAAGRAAAVIEALFFGPTARLLWLACDRAPIAYSGLAHVSPSQHIIQRTLRLSANKHPTSIMPF